MAQFSNKNTFFIPGRYGDYTVYERNGKLIVRSKKNDKGNPSKSQVQSATRLRWNNVQRLWGTFPSDWHPSFQNRTAGCSDYNTFMSLNMHGTPIYFTKQEVENFATVLVPLVVSNGILKEIVVEQKGAGLVSDIVLDDLMITPQTTVGQFAKAVMKNNRDYSQGDRLTFVQGTQTMHLAVPHASFECHTIVLDLYSQQLLSETVGASDGFVMRDGVLASNVTDGAATWVHERLGANGKRIVSPQRLWCDNEEMIAQYTSQEALVRAAESYSKGKAAFLRPEPTLADTAGKL